MIKKIATLAFLISGMATPSVAQVASPYEICINTAYLVYSNRMSVCNAMPSQNAEQMNRKASCINEARTKLTNDSFDCRTLLP